MSRRLHVQKPEHGVNLSGFERLFVPYGGARPVGVIAEDVNPSHMFESMSVPEAGEGDNYKTPGGEGAPPASLETKRNIGGINAKGATV